LVNAVDTLSFGPDIHRVVAVAPDLADHNQAASLVIGSLLPNVDHRFAPGMLAISGISRGAIGALAVAQDPAAGMISVGLHSPALHLQAPIEDAPWRCLIDVGDDDSLAAAATDTASMLRDSGIDVTERHWPGGHDRQYWRAHLVDYLAFHLDSAQRSIT
ncbi:MAG: esterase, partial [Acidimicrobiaceae bacterium]